MNLPELQNLRERTMKYLMVDPISAPDLAKRIGVSYATVLNLLHNNRKMFTLKTGLMIHVFLKKNNA